MNAVHQFQSRSGFKTQKIAAESFVGIEIEGTGLRMEMQAIKILQPIKIFSPDSYMIDFH
jgi:hypothetical protein